MTFPETYHTLLAFVTPGPFEMMIIGIVALLLFGNRLPDVARNIGKSFSELRKGMREIDLDNDR